LAEDFPWCVHPIVVASFSFDSFTLSPSFLMVPNPNDTVLNGPNKPAERLEVLASTVDDEVAGDLVDLEPPISTVTATVRSNIFPIVHVGSTVRHGDDTFGFHVLDSEGFDPVVLYVGSTPLSGSVFWPNRRDVLEWG
jgi:hypothetical protein